MGKIFEHPNTSDFICPICYTQADKRVVLIPIYGTQEDNLIKCKQVHLDCLLDGIMYYEKQSILALLCS